MAKNRRNALFFLYSEQRNAKIALGKAENKRGVKPEELDNLHRRLDALDWLIPLAIAADDTADEKEGGDNDG